MRAPDVVKKCAVMLDFKQESMRPFKKLQQHSWYEEQLYQKMNLFVDKVKVNKGELSAFSVPIYSPCTLKADEAVLEISTPTLHLFTTFCDKTKRG